MSNYALTPKCKKQVFKLWLLFPNILLQQFNITSQEVAGSFYSNLNRGLANSPHSSHFTAVGKQARSIIPLLSTS